MLASPRRFALCAAFAAALTGCGARDSTLTPPTTGTVGPALGAQRMAASVANGTGSPARVQQFTYASAVSTGETSSTVALGTSGTQGTAPAPGDTLVALISLDDAGGTPTVTAPAGWTQAPGGTVNAAWVHEAVATYVVGSTPPASVTFTYNERVGALITIVEVANTAGVDVVTSATANVGNPWPTGSGSGTQSGLNDLALASFAIADANLTPGSLANYTLLRGAGRHGDGTSTYGHSAGIYASNAPLTSGTVSPVTISWSDGSGTEAAVGQQVLMMPAGSGTGTATATSTPAPGGSGSSSTQFANAQDYATSFTPYASGSVWNMPVSGSPAYLANSASIVAAQFPGGGNPNPVRATEAGQYDYSHPRYFASSSDPLVNVNCTMYCGTPDNGGVPAKINVPAQARPALGGDAHFDVVQPNGNELSMWLARQPSGNWTNGSTLSTAVIANCGSYATGAGWLTVGPGPTAAGYCDDAGVVTAAELIAGRINHALFVVGQCAVGAQYPTEGYVGTNQCSSGVGPPLGAREWYDVPCATTQANAALRPWEKAILCALNQYGAYFGDTNGGGGSYFTGGVQPMVESEEPWYAYNGPGYVSPFAPLAAQGWSKITIPGAIGSSSGTRWVGADPWQPSGVNFAAHIHWLAPCSARGTC